jgi:HEAT repeat protein
MTDPTPTLDTLFDQIRHGTDLERRRARIACIDFGEAAVPGLIALLQDDNAAVRHAAINTLGHLKSAAVANALRDRVYNETDIYARGQAIVALAHCAKEAAVPDLLTMLDWQDKGRQEFDKRLCEYAIEAVRTLTMPTLPPELETWAIAQIESLDIRNRILGIWLIKTIAKPETIAALEQALLDYEFMPYRYQRRYAPATYQFNRFRPISISTLAQSALLHVKQHKAVEWALLQLKTGDLKKRQQAIMDLWFSGDDRCLPLLFEKLNDHEADESGMTIADLARETLQNWVKWRGLQPTPEQAAQLGL